MPRAGKASLRNLLIALLLTALLGGAGLLARDRFFSAPRGAASSEAAPDRRVPPPRPLPPAGPAELALLAPLVVGEEIESWKLKELSAVDEGTIHLVFVARKGRAKIEILVALADDQGPEPPIVVGRYSLFYSVKSVMQSEGDALARAVAKRLEKNKDLPPPPGLAPYHPVDKKSDPL